MRRSRASGATTSSAAGTTVLRFVTALEAEARPLIEHYRLVNDSDGEAFKIFRRDGVALIISGIGKAAAAAATAFLHLAASGEQNAVWLNVGIAGHGTRGVGEAILAHKVHDHGSGRSWYPPLVFKPPCATDQVTTVDRPERQMTSTGAFDMEASGFVATASRFASAELVHCLKFVSDGPGTDLESLTPRGVRRLVEQHIAVVESVATACGKLSRELREVDAQPLELEVCLKRWRFTVTDQRELHRLLRRRQTLAAELPLPLGDVGASVRGKEVNRRLRDWLDGLPVEIG